MQAANTTGVAKRKAFLTLYRCSEYQPSGEREGRLHGGGMRRCEGLADMRELDCNSAARVSGAFVTAGGAAKHAAAVDGESCKAVTLYSLRYLYALCTP